MLGSLIARVDDVVCALMWGEAGKKLADCRADGIEVSCGGLAQQMLELGEDLFDWVEVGRVFRQEEELGACRTDGPADSMPLVAAEVIHDDDVVRPQGGGETRRARPLIQTRNFRGWLRPQ